MNTTEKIIEWFKNHEEETADVMEELDGYNGFLGDDRMYPMENLDELYQDTPASEILARAFYGYDYYYTDKEDNHTTPFNPNRNYFFFNGYGNLVSIDEKDYSNRIDDYFVEELKNNSDYIEIPEEVAEMLDEEGD